MPIQPGQKAPEFELPDQNRTTVSLGQFLGRSAVVLFFYPKDGTTGCTMEACAFRDESATFDARGATLLGISSDSTDSHKRFASKYGLPMTLLSDKGGKVRKLYGVPSTFGIIPGRATFVIDKAGVVRHVFVSQSEPTRHVSEALAALA
jgi:peroxiredoxin Q/BCP